MKGTETAIGSDERCALAAVIIFAKHGKELLACVLTAGMVSFSRSSLSVSPVFGS